MKRVRSFVWPVGLVLSLAAGAVAGDPPQYTITILSPPGATNSSATRINNLGEVIGTANNSATVWVYQNGTYTFIPALPGSRSYYPNDINDHGQVIGSAFVAGDGQYHGYSYQNGVTTDLGIYQPSSINNLGQISAYLNDASRALLIDGPTVTTLPTLGGSFAIAGQINEHGQIVGYGNLTTGGPEHPFLYANGTMTDLGLLPGFARGGALGINQNGDITGYMQYAGLPVDRRAFLYHNGVMTDLGLPTPFNYTDTTGVSPTGINDSGQIVGLIGDLGSGAFVYTGGQMYDIQSLIPRDGDWHPIGATGINDAGQIVVNEAGLDMSHNSLSRSLLLTPIPEPAGLALIVCCGFGLLRPRRRSGPRSR
jgi:probable HAF family extracellular repeat protein